MTFASEIASPSRRPVTYIEIDLDFCSRTFGVAPCNATGTPCYNTRQTCVFLTAWQNSGKTYRFSSADAPLPFSTGERPYILSVDYLPTEIVKNKTVTGRASLVFADEPDSDIGVDPYVATRSSTPGTFWKKLLARNPHFAGRSVRIYQGFAGLSVVEYKRRFTGKIESVRLNGGQCEIECVDTIADLDKLVAPKESNWFLPAPLLASMGPGTGIPAPTDTSVLTSTGYIRIDDEIIKYNYFTFISFTFIVVLERGSFGSAVVDHGTGKKIQPCLYLTEQNPFNIAYTLVTTYGGLVPFVGVNPIDFANAANVPGGEPDFWAVISKPTKVSDLFFSLIDLLDAKAWIDEEGLLTVSRNLPNFPGRVATVLSDTANIVRESVEMDANDTSRRTRFVLYWEYIPWKEEGRPENYARIDVIIDADKESADEYGAVAQEDLRTPFLRTGLISLDILTQYTQNLLRRRLLRTKDAQPIVTLRVELKDEGLLVGTFVVLDSDIVQDVTGENLVSAVWQITRRKSLGSQVELTLVLMQRRRICFIAPGGHPDYAVATFADKQYGYIGGDPAILRDFELVLGEPGYFIY